MKALSLPIASLLVVTLGACDATERDPDETAGKTSEGAAGELRNPPGQAPAGCEAVPNESDLARWLAEVPGQAEAGGMFSGRKEWAATVNRNGEVCALAVSTEDPSAAWPGSRAIAMAKAFTANAFSTDDQPLSTARLYTLSQPGHSLWGVANGNPFNVECLSTPDDVDVEPRLCGGSIAFGGGVPLYHDNTRVGGLGVSGDTPCADHEIAKRIRNAAGLNPPGGRAIDDIQYVEADGESIFAHALCPNTWRDGQKIGEESLASAQPFRAGASDPARQPPAPATETPDDQEDP